jgi:antitoxin (DNA-binding transcriptional repressor) of toxin-antitoxin stability system
MKTLTTRELFHAPGLLRSLRPGQSLVVTDNGVPAFTVTKAGKRTPKTAEDLRREARQMFPGKRPKVNFTEIIKKLKSAACGIRSGIGCGGICELRR